MVLVSDVTIIVLAGCHIHKRTRYGVQKVLRQTSPSSSRHRLRHFEAGFCAVLYLRKVLYVPLIRVATGLYPQLYFFLKPAWFYDYMIILPANGQALTCISSRHSQHIHFIVSWQDRPVLVENPKGRAPLAADFLPKLEDNAHFLVSYFSVSSLFQRLVLVSAFHVPLQNVPDPTWSRPK